MRSILIVLIITFSTPVFGQSHFVGFRGGANWTKVNSSNLANNADYRNGFSGGLTYEYLLNKRIKLGIDLLYAQKGFTNDIIFTDVNGLPTGERATTAFNYDYLSLPIKGGFVFGEKVSGFVNLGLVPSLLLGAKVIEPAIDGIMEEKTHNMTGVTSTFDLGGMVEIGAAYKFQEKYILFTAFDFQHSFTTINGFNGWHYGMTFSLGLKYALKKMAISPATN